MSSNTRCSGLSRQRGYSTFRMASAFSRSKPIENVWDALGRQVDGRNYPPTNKNTLIRALTEEWDKLPQQLLDNAVQTKVKVRMLFQHDGAPTHFSADVRSALDTTYPGRWIGRGGPVIDFCLDFFIWGHMKNLVTQAPSTPTRAWLRGLPS
ncbi:hypothetical protein TNCV_2096541 [Trichonephila clavipes]|nr:hypothetical protein TNCV_2096541 [Trichonephila clavipes]